MVREHPSNEWRTIGGIEIWFNGSGKAVRAVINGTTKYPYVQGNGGMQLASGELSYVAVRSRTQRETIRWM